VRERNWFQMGWYWRSRLGAPRKQAEEEVKQGGEIMPGVSRFFQASF